MIAIIDYGMGNLRSVQKAFERVGADARVTQNPEEIKNADKVVLPGVGAMAPAMDKLQELNLIPAIRNFIAAGKPFLGICLGFQLLFERSEEGGEIKGLGILGGIVDRFTQLKVPQIGWNQLHITSPASSLLKGVEEAANVYFCHSYFVKPSDKRVIAATAHYAVNFTAAVARDNLFGVQFHPEKSQTVGLQILKNFSQL
jgi:glutamine amidotransferase